jgi:alkylhydroperoxidase family enzyme
MGHCEMLLAVAGLDEKTIAQKTRLLAEGDWSSFSAADRAAFSFARKLSEAPASITTEEMEALRKHFGPERMLDVVWWACRCHYMTRVADALQLPLERENVFQQPAKKE